MNMEAIVGGVVPRPITPDYAFFLAGDAMRIVTRQRMEIMGVAEVDEQAQKR